MTAVPSELVFLPRPLIDECMTFRDASILAWKHRRHQSMSMAYFALQLGSTLSNVSRYLDERPLNSKGQPRPDLPAALIPRACELLGNRAMFQYLAKVGVLTLMEEALPLMRHA